MENNINSQNKQQRNNLILIIVIPLFLSLLNGIAAAYPWLMIGLFSIGLIIIIFICLGICKRIYCLYLSAVIISTIKNVTFSGLIIYYVFNKYDYNILTSLIFVFAFAFVLLLVIEPLVLFLYKNRVKNYCNSNMNEVIPFINYQEMNVPNNPIPNGFNPYFTGQNIPPIIPNSYQGMNIRNDITPMKNDITQNYTSQYNPNRNIDNQNNAYQPPSMEDLNNQDNLYLSTPMKNENN